MLNFCSLYSGSTGNSLYIESSQSKILVDAGVSMKKITEALDSIHTNIEEIDAIIVTHEHGDHIKSIGSLSKKYNIPVYANEKTWNAMPKQAICVANENKRSFCVAKKFEIEDLIIEPFHIPHDAADPCGFNIYKDNKKISIATDLGHVDEKTTQYLKESSFVMLESNYDPEILKCCSYPYILKTRIAGPNGHLSNSLAGKTICSLIDTGLTSVMLGHLSKENNFPELAYKTVIEELNEQNYKESCISLNVASRIGPSNLIEVC